MVGVFDGFEVGALDGDVLGELDGDVLGELDGDWLGMELGFIAGRFDVETIRVGWGEGEPVGECDAGGKVGAIDGSAVTGAIEGTDVGVFVEGANVGGGNTFSQPQASRRSGRSSSLHCLSGIPRRSSPAKRICSQVTV